MGLFIDTDPATEPAAPDCTVIRLALGESEALVEYEIEPGDADVGLDSGVVILGALINGRWVDPEVFAESVVYQWEQSIWEAVRLQNERDRDDYEARRSGGW